MAKRFGVVHVGVKRVGRALADRGDDDSGNSFGVGGLRFF